MKKLILFAALSISSTAYSTEEDFRQCFAGAQNQFRAAIYKDMGASAMETYDKMAREPQAGDTSIYNEIMRNAIKTVYADPNYTVEFAREKQSEIIKNCQIKFGSVNPYSPK